MNLKVAGVHCSLGSTNSGAITSRRPHASRHSSQPRTATHPQMLEIGRVERGSGLRSSRSCLLWALGDL